MKTKLYEDLTEMLQDQMKKIAKKNDITPQELDNVYKAIDVLKDIETIKAMQEAGEENGYSQEGYSQEGYSNRRGVKGTGRGRYSNEYSQRYPIYPPMMFDGVSNDGSYTGNSYAPVWNQNRNTEMHEHQGENSNAGGGMSNNQSMDYSNNSYDYSNRSDYSNRRGRDAHTGRYVSRDRGYSRADEKEHMLDRLEDMLDDASSERERRAIEQCIERISK